MFSLKLIYKNMGMVHLTAARLGAAQLTAVSIGREIQLGAKLNWARNTTGRETQLTANHNWAPNTIRREKLGAKYN